jgi:hypothetical protein
MAQFNCAVCLEQASPPAVVTRCGHLFCWSCLDAWASQRGRRTVPCPVCNGAVDVDHETTPIYGAGDSASGRAHPSQHRQADANGAAHVPPAAGAHDARPQARAQPAGAAGRPPPQADRRADAAPPPVNGGGFFGFNNPFRGGAIAGGFFPLVFMSFGGGAGGMGFDTLLTLSLFGLGIFGVINMLGQNGNGNAWNQGLAGHFYQLFNGARDLGRAAANFLFDNFHAIAWVIVILLAFTAGADSLFSPLPPLDFAAAERRGGNVRRARPRTDR